MEPPPPAEPAVTAATLNGAHTPLSEDHDEKYGVPTLEELGFDTEGLHPPVWQGGETEALTRLGRHLERKAWVRRDGGGFFGSSPQKGADMNAKTASFRQKLRDDKPGNGFNGNR